MDGFTKHVEWKPGYDRRDEGYGITSMRLRFVLVGPRGATQFYMATGWYPASCRRGGVEPTAYDRGYHWPTPRYPEQHQMDDCDHLPGGRCYYDGSGLAADPILARFITEGESAVWEELRSYYDALCADEDAEATA